MSKFTHEQLALKYRDRIDGLVCALITQEYGIPDMDKLIERAFKIALRIDEQVVTLYNLKSL